LVGGKIRRGNPKATRKSIKEGGKCDIGQEALGLTLKVEGCYIIVKTTDLFRENEEQCYAT